MQSETVLEPYVAMSAWFLLSTSSPSTEMLAMYSFAVGRLFRTVAMIEAYTVPVHTPIDSCVSI